MAIVLATGLGLLGCGTDSLGPNQSEGLDSILDGELALSPTELLITDASTGAFTVTLIRPNGTVVTHLGGGTAITWTSSAPGIASVTSGGVATAKQPGVAEIVARMGDRVARAPVVVLPVPTHLQPMFDGEMSGTAGASLPDSVEVRVVDRGGIPVSGVEVRFAVELGAGSIQPVVAVTDGSGIARTQWQLGIDGGDNALKASVDGLDDILIRARGAESGIDNRIQLVGGNSQNGRVDEALGQTLRVRVVNAAGAPLANVPVEWEFDDGGAQIEGGGGTAAVAQTIANTDGTGVSGVRWRLGRSSGLNRARARLPNNVELWFQAQAIPGVAIAMSLSPAVSSLGVGGRMRLTSLARDRFGNSAAASGTTWLSSDPAVAAVDAAGTVTALTVGQTTITATSGALKASASLNVDAFAAAAIRLSSGNGQSASVGSTLPDELAVHVSAPGGAPLGGVIVVWSVTDGDGSLAAASSVTDGAGVARMTLRTGLRAGVNRVSATTSTLAPVTFIATGTAGVGASVSLTPSNTTVGVGGTKRIQATTTDAYGNGVSGGTFVWSSANPAVATVDVDGQVTGVAAGSTAVSATSGSLAGTTVVTVSAQPDRVVLDVAAATLNAIGDTVRLTARALDAGGTDVPGASITWSSLSPGVATVDQLGRVVSQSVGVALITVSVACCQADTAIVDSRQILAGVSLSPSAPSLQVGESLQLLATPADSNGVVVEGAAVHWSSSTPSVVAVSANGVLSGVSSGSAMIQAVVEAPGSPGQQESVSVSVAQDSNPPPPPPPPPPTATLAELPRAYVDTAEPTTTRDVHVAANGNLQSAINSAQRGDRILLAPGGRYDAVTLPAKSGSGWIVIQTDASLPAGRMTPAIASSLNLAVIEGGVANQPVIVATGDVSYYRIQGVVVRAKSGVTDLGDMIRVNTDRSITSALVQPSYIIFDRVYVHGNPPALQLKRCFGLSGQNVAVVNSSLLGCSKLGQDSQAVFIADGLGPTAIINNHLQAGSELIMPGGIDPHITGVVPSDIEIRRNYFHRPLAWRDGSIGDVKNLLEIKNAQRVLIESNVMEGNWTHAQDGWSILIKSTNQSGGCNWCTADDITIRWNLIDDAENGLSIIWGNSTGAPHAETERVVVENNVFARLGPNGNQGGMGTPLRIGQMPGDILIRSNTFENTAGRHFMMYFGVGGPGTNVSITGNVGWGGLYEVWVGDGATLRPGQFAGNTMIGAGGPLCSQNNCPGSAQSQTVTLAGRTYTLPVVAGQGANLTELAQRLQSVR